MQVENEHSPIGVPPVSDVGEFKGTPLQPMEQVHKVVPVPRVPAIAAALKVLWRQLGISSSGASKQQDQPHALMWAMALMWATTSS